MVTTRYIRYLLATLLGSYRSAEAQVAHWGASIGLAPWLEAWRQGLNGELAWLLPYLLVSFFWALDMALGAAVALKGSRFSPSRFARGMGKLFLWYGVLVMAWGVRLTGSHYHAYGLHIPLNLFADLLELLILFTEIASNLRNVGDLTDNPTLKRILRRFADRYDVAASQLAEMRVELSALRGQISSPESIEVDSQPPPDRPQLKEVSQEGS